MKQLNKITVFVLILVVLMILPGCIGQEEERPPVTITQTATITEAVTITQGPTTISGEYLMVGNPCTTDPCLPGIVYAVLAEDTYYYLTVEGSFLWKGGYDDPSWDGYTPKEGDYVQVTGCMRREVDVFGEPFYVLEVLSLQLAE